MGKQVHNLAGRTLSLNQLEHQLIRPQFRDPRIHVALVCAARSCPGLRPEAYTAEQLEIQLEDQSIQFANNSDYVDYDAEENTLRLSPILDWYQEDWEPQGGYLSWLANRVKDDRLHRLLQRAAAGEVKVSFLDYDWSLNTQQSASSQGKQKSGQAEFGSGTIPNG